MNIKWTYNVLFKRFTQRHCTDKYSYMHNVRMIKSTYYVEMPRSLTVTGKFTIKLQMESIFWSSFTVVSGKRELFFHGHKLSYTFTERKIPEFLRSKCSWCLFLPTSAICYLSFYNNMGRPVFCTVFLRQCFFYKMKHTWDPKEKLDSTVAEVRFWDSLCFTSHTWITVSLSLIAPVPLSSADMSLFAELRRGRWDPAGWGAGDRQLSNNTSAELLSKASLKPHWSKHDNFSFQIVVQLTRPCQCTA